jgi:CRP-like cAMP-binding protein
LAVARKKSTGRDTQPLKPRWIRWATEEDFNKARVNEHLGFFLGISAETLATLVQNAAVYEFERGTELFTQGYPVEDLGLYIVLNGELEVVHTLESKRRRVAIDTTGMVIGDIEYYAKSLPGLSPRDIPYNETQSTIQGRTKGQVLWIRDTRILDTLHETDQALRRNMVRLLCVKLLQRNANVDPLLVADNRPLKEKVKDHLKELLESGQEVAADGSSVDNGPYIFRSETSVYGIAEALGVERYRVYYVFQKDFRDDCQYESDRAKGITIYTMSRELYNELTRHGKLGAIQGDSLPHSASGDPRPAAP